jgi:hypothetical protein
MTRNVRTIQKAPGTHPFSVSMLEMWILMAIQVVGLVVSLILH